MTYKIYFPTGYHIKHNNEAQDDDIDINVVLENERVYFATLVTCRNILYVLAKDQTNQYWTEDMFVLKDLRIQTIYSAIDEAIAGRYFERVFYFLGTIQTVLPDYTCFERIPEPLRIL